MFKYYFLIAICNLLLGLNAKAQDTTTLKRIFYGNGSLAEKAKASRELAWYFQERKLEEEAIYWAKLGMRYALETQNDSILCSQYLVLTTLQEEAGMLEEAKASYLEYIDLQQKKKKHKWLAVMYNNLAVLYGNQGLLPLCVEYYIKAVKIYQELGLKNDAVETEANLASIYIQQGEAQRGIDLLRSFIIHFKAIDNKTSLISAYGNTAKGFVVLKQADSALFYSDLSIATARQFGNLDRMFSVWYGRGAIASKLGINKEFKVANDSMLYYARLTGNVQRETQTYDNLGMYYATVTGDMLKAKEYFEMALAGSEKMGNKGMTVYILNNLAASYEGLGDYAKAYKFMERAYKLKDSIITDAGMDKIAEMQTRFQTEKKEAQIKLLDESNKLQKRTSYFMIAGLGLLAIVGLSLYRNNRIKQKSNRQLAILNNSLEEANQTKAKLFGIISHDLRSPISQVYQFLKLQQMAPDKLDEEQRNKLSNKIQSATGSLLETMEDLLLWSKTQMNNFNTDMQPVAVDEVVVECLQLLQLNIEAKHITISNHLASDINVKSDPYFLQTILRNLLQNAIKASPENGDIIIDFKDQQLSIANSGGHFSQQHYEQLLASKEDVNSLSGLGLRLVDELSKKIGAKVFFAVSDQYATIVHLVFPH